MELQDYFYILKNKYQQIVTDIFVEYFTFEAISITIT